MHHELKCESKYFFDILTGKKKFELRKNDRNFKPGDTFELVETENEKTTGAVSNPFEIRYVLTGGQYGLDPDYCIFNW
jgi:ASC-1-like (ASCH) protein